MRSIPTITKNLLIINVLVFIATYVFGRTGADLDNIFGLHFFLASDFHLYQLFTYMFMHANVEHIFFNMFALDTRKVIVECGENGSFSPKEGSFYMLATSQIANVGFSDLPIIAANSQEILNQWTTVGASGAIYAILLAFGMIFPEERIFIFPLPVPIKAKWFVCIYVAIELFSALATTNDSVAHFAHLGGMLFGFLMIRYWRKHPHDNEYRQGIDRYFFDKLRNNWEKHSHKKANHFDHESSSSTNPHHKDWDYNAQKKADQEEIDRILDKIRRSGYDSLTTEEKRRLFENDGK